MLEYKCPKCNINMKTRAMTSIYCCEVCELTYDNLFQRMILNWSDSLSESFLIGSFNECCKKLNLKAFL